MHGPRISVMMNVYNGAAFVRDALDSLRAQTFGDWELVFWDNASSDGTAGIAAEFDDARMRYFRAEQTIAPAHAREHAIRVARGEWLAFLDHDDIWLPDKLARQLEVAESDREAAIVYGRAVSFSDSGDEHDFDHRREFGLLLEGDLFQRLVTDSCFIQMSSVMLRRSAVLAVGGIPDWIRVISDYYLYLELARRFPVRAVQGVVCRYRKHPGSLTHTAARAMHSEVLLLLDRWAGSLDPKIVARRRRIHATGLAVAELRNPGTRAGGLARLIRDGSVGFLLTRPLVWAYRSLRRRWREPIWTKEAARAAPGKPFR